MTTPSASPQARRAVVRLDELLVAQGLAETRERARALVMAGEVLVGGQPARAPAARVGDGVAIELKTRPRFVSRGGEKLDAALTRSGIDVRGRRCLDAGASTGGFTDCLLQRGAAHVTAVDVAYGEFATRLREHPRVELLERTNARDLAALETPVALCVVDVSFISLRTVLPALLRSVAPGGDLLVLVKPQFEAERGEVEHGGVVRDPLLHASVVARVALWAIERGLRMRGVIRSPLTGPAGNREFFLWLRQPAAAA